MVSVIAPSSIRLEVNCSKQFRKRKVLEGKLAAAALGSKLLKNEGSCNSIT
jgi:hypothetical protein